MHVKKGDRVVVVSGNDKGRSGLVLQSYPERDRVLVEGINLRWKHRKPTQQSPNGERVQVEVPIHASNVMPLDPQTGKGTRRRPNTAKA
jgi:large subunit ribosomal protein L24